MTMPKPVLRSPCRVLASGSESDFQNFHPHLHVLSTDGCFYKDSSDRVAKVIYQSKSLSSTRSGNAKTTKTFDAPVSSTGQALDWLTQLVSHIPNKSEQMVRYYGFYSNKSRGLRKEAGTDDQVPALIDSDISPQVFRKTWARLIQKIYNVNPLLCPKCLGSMKIISFIQDQEVIYSRWKGITSSAIHRDKSFGDSINEKWLPGFSFILTSK